MARTSWFDDKAEHEGIQEKAQKLDSFTSALADGVVSKQEVDGQEKRLLREAFRGWIPDEILWRRKEQFGDGSGTADAMDRVTDSLVPDADWAAVRFDGLPPARTREELGYQRIFAGHLAGINAEQVLGRFATA